MDKSEDKLDAEDATVVHVSAMDKEEDGDQDVGKEYLAKVPPDDGNSAYIATLKSGMCIETFKMQLPFVHRNVHSATPINGILDT